MGSGLTRSSRRDRLGAFLGCVFVGVGCLSAGCRMSVADSWFHEYGFVGAADFGEAQAAVEALGFEWLYGSADPDPEWPGWPAHCDVLEARLEAATDALREIEAIAGSKQATFAGIRMTVATYWKRFPETVTSDSGKPST